MQESKNSQGELYKKLAEFTEHDSYEYPSSHIRTVIEEFLDEAKAEWDIIVNTSGKELWWYGIETHNWFKKWFGE